MLQQRTVNRPTTAPKFGSSTSCVHIATAFKQRPCRPCKRRKLQLHCIHKEYARQGAAQQEAVGSSNSNSANAFAASRQQLLSVPEDIVLECLTVMRRGELSGLQPYLPSDSIAPQGAPVLLAGVPVHEQGPLARCSPFMDAAARRVLPGHLLRRSRVLSSLQVGGTCLMRVALTACTGEETVLVWKLALTALPGIQQHEQQLQPLEQQLEQPGLLPQQQEQHTPQQPQQLQSQQMHEVETQQASEQHDSAQHLQAQHQPSPLPAPPPQQQQQHQPQQPPLSSSSSSSSSAAAAANTGLSRPQACWQVVSISQEAFSEDNDQQQDLPASPHPRVSPELVVRAQLQALRQQQLLRACGFNLMGRHASSSGWEAHLAAFRQLLLQPHYRLLGEHQAAELGASALPSQRQFLQEVVLIGPSSSSSSSSGSGNRRDGGGGGGEQLVGRFLWRLGMQADGCWMVRSIEVL